MQKYLLLINKIKILKKIFKTYKQQYQFNKYFYKSYKNIFNPYTYIKHFQNKKIKFLLLNNYLILIKNKFLLNLILLKKNQLKLIKWSVVKKNIWKWKKKKN